MEHAHNSTNNGLLKDFVDLKRFCADLGITPKTAQRWQARRIGPPRMMIGKKLYYRISSIEEWLRKREKQASTGRAA